jgi:pimeloyl-ACP methyl ester carboxylesterase
VVARYFAQEMGDPRIVQTISLASPFAGVRNARWLGVDVARDIDPSSKLLRTIRLGSRRELGVPHLSLVAEDDAVVRAPMSHALPGGDVTLIRRCGHNTMLYHEETARLVERRVLEMSELTPQRAG